MTYPAKSLFQLYFRVGGFTTLMFCMWVAMFGGFSEVALREGQRFAETGEVAKARVEDKYFRTERDADGDRERRRYLDLTFETRSGEQIALSRRVQSNEYKDATIGDVIEVVYLRDDPERIEVTPGKNERTGRTLRIFAWFSVLALLGSLFLNGRRALDAFKARKAGACETVQIETVQKSGRWIFTKGYRLVWRDRAGRGGKSLHRKADDLMGLRAGDWITIYHGPKRTWWAGDVGTRA